jgi:hypothetical protein
MVEVPLDTLVGKSTDGRDNVLVCTKKPHLRGWIPITGHLLVSLEEWV